ncbi:MAG: HlyD family efflux transporter periplasmic adaptor subunit, partial [Planctomycetota bacterium]
AESELELARTTVERDRNLIGSGAIAQSVLDQSESSFRTAGANLTRAAAALDGALQGERSAEASLLETRGTFRVREADLAALQASRAELVNQLEQAQTDFDARVLRAPFQGRVTARYVERGAFVNAGTPVVQLTMETAVKVVITVSAEQERQIALGMQMPIYTGVDGGSVPRMGTVFEKASIADAGTRTFRIGLILPNPILGVDDQVNGADVASVGDLFPVLNLPGTPPDHLYVNVACTFERDGQTFVLALSRESAAGATPGSVQMPTAVPVVFTDDWDQLDTATLRRIEPTDALQMGDPLVVSPTAADEAGVRIGSLQYAFRPGDVVRVGVDAALPTAGLWVPTTALVPRTGASLLFVIEDGVAREVVVDLVETSGSFRRVVAPDLTPGASIVVNGMQYLADGDTVTIRNATDRGGV